MGPRFSLVTALAEINEVNDFRVSRDSPSWFLKLPINLNVSELLFEVTGVSATAAMLVPPWGTASERKNVLRSLQWLERPVDVNKVYGDVARPIYFYYTKHELFGISLLGKQVFQCLLKGSLAYIYIGLFMWMKHAGNVYGKMSSHRNFLCTAGK